MKTLIFLLTALMASTTMAQDKTIVTVRGGEVNSGVVILTVHPVNPASQAKAQFALHCNKGMADCANPPVGNYWMVRLPKNWGSYDCNNVDLYPASAEPDNSQKIGEYCLIEK